MKVGIDKISFFVPPYYVDMAELATARAVDPGKYLIGIGQSQMAIGPSSQDIVTYAANAASNILTKEDKEAIDLVIVGTESSFDESKASAVILHRLLGIQEFARAFEIKEACYGATAGIEAAKNHIRQHPKSKALVIAADIARYGLNNGGEPTQGAGAVAMIISSEPKILALSEDTVNLTQDIYDFWRPTGHAYPLVDGPLSNETYINSFKKVYTRYEEIYQESFDTFAALAFHIPYTKMGRKALQAVLPKATPQDQERLLARYEESITYSRQVGNLYTGSLYLGLISLLENSTSLQAGDKLGLFSYGSGAVSQFFTGTLQPGYEKQLLPDHHKALLTNRTKLSVFEYEEMFKEAVDYDATTTFNDPLPFSITTIKDNIRFYRNEDTK
ncbi:hydroxymethylglutaryl-CoA synthase [Enterococcus canintestini]|uniref:Hydroxymethylglutaryl-CoA synthase n=1 Tax=Enterococcus canintestini TaxID=317010 RepID=A0A267HQA2_9ENTE|nr:hydroxymethylglutaryl-CoA synthase [Enterococcus canintestini]PAA99814.1 hydroxymethylglutaryl-CoA synthase [Enterococcus canintestini]